MNFLKKNKGAVIFYLLILVSTLVIINDVERENGSNKYVMTYMPN